MAANVRKRAGLGRLAPDGLLLTDKEPSSLSQPINSGMVFAERFMNNQ